MFGFKRKVVINDPALSVEYKYVLLDPKVIDRMRGNSQVSYRSWYRAIYYIYNLPRGQKVNISEVTRLASCSWPTARLMIERIRENSTQL